MSTGFVHNSENQEEVTPNKHELSRKKLGKAVDEGFKARATFEGDEDLAPLRSDPRFAELLKRLTS
jgi:hypothetical protein